MGKHATDCQKLLPLTSAYIQEDISNPKVIYRVEKSESLPHQLHKLKPIQWFWKHVETTHNEGRVASLATSMISSFRYK